MSFNAINDWLSAHELLVFSLMIPFVSAIVAFFSSWYSTRRVIKSESQRQEFERLMKISEFRQTWINTLRDNLAEFQSYGILPNSEPHKKRDFYKLGTKIELLMNPEDSNYPKLEKYLYEFLEASESAVEQKYAINAGYVKLCQDILKVEWDRLKAELKDPSKFMDNRK